MNVWLLVMIGITLVAVMLNFVFHAADWQHVRRRLFAEQYLQRHRVLHTKTMWTGEQIKRATKQLKELNSRTTEAGEEVQEFDIDKEITWLMDYCRRLMKVLRKQRRADHRALWWFPSECNGKKKTICPTRHNRWKGVYNDTNDAFQLLHELEIDRVLRIANRR